MTGFDEDGRKAKEAIAAARASRAAVVRALKEMGELLPTLEPEDADRVVADLRLMIACVDFEFRHGVFAIRGGSDADLRC